MKRCFFSSRSIHPDDFNPTGKTFAELRQVNSRYFIQCDRGPVYQLLVDEVQVNESLKQLDSSGMDCTMNFDDCFVVNRILEKHLREPITSFVPMVSYELESDLTHPLMMSTSTESIYFQGTVGFEKIPLKPEYCGIKKVLNLVHCL